jgi:hypothetical protein
MSAKEEVNKLSDVYSSLLKENFEGGVNVGVDTGLSNPLASTTEIEDNNLDDNVPDIQMSDSEAIVSMLSPTAPVSNHSDSNTDMAKSELYKLVKAGSSLLQMLMEGSCIKIEPWQLSKITKASDYICAVKNSIEFDEFEKMAGEMVNDMSELNSPVVSKVKNILAGEPMEVNEEVLKQIIFNIECLKEAKKVENNKICLNAKKGCCCKKCPKCRENSNKKKK